jgi:hypothetical protein
LIGFLLGVPLSVPFGIKNSKYPRSSLRVMPYSTVFMTVPYVFESKAISSSIVVLSQALQDVHGDFQFFVDTFPFKNIFFKMTVRDFDNVP